MVNMFAYRNNIRITGRPLSPHVLIYAFPPAAISSITVRITGVGLAAGFAGAGVMALTGADIPALMSTVGASSIGPAAKFVVAFPFTFHYLGGVRHFFWDYFPENLLTNEKVEMSSFVLFGAALGISGAAAMISF